MCEVEAVGGKYRDSRVCMDGNFEYSQDASHRFSRRCDLDVTRRRSGREFNLTGINNYIKHMVKAVFKNHSRYVLAHAIACLPPDSAHVA